MGIGAVEGAEDGEQMVIYFDQNALIELGVRSRKEEFRRKLEKAIESGAFSPVVSLWHLIETANTNNVANAIELAEFVDWLKPTWLLERRNIQELMFKKTFGDFSK